MRSALRYLRHGPLKRYQRFWTGLGKGYQHAVKTLPFLPGAKQKVGPYGPFHFHPCFAFSAFHRWGGNHNAGFMACVDACRNKHCVIDIGAHIGLVTMPMSQMIAENGKVYAFEPATANRRYLEYHLRKNNIRNVEVYPVLVGNQIKDDVPFFELNADTGMNSVVPMHHQGNFKPTRKMQTTLDVFCREHALKPDVIKIDVEGYEIEVLQGAQETLKNNNTVIFLSVHPRHLKDLGHEISELTDLINDIGYRITELDGSPVEEFTLSEYLVSPPGVKP